MRVAVAGYADCGVRQHRAGWAVILTAIFGSLALLNDPALAQAPGSLPFPKTTYLAHIVTGNGYVTKITLTDLSGAANSVLLLYMNQDGSVQSTANYVLAPGGTVRITTSESARFATPTTRWAIINSLGTLTANLFFEVQSSGSDRVMNTVGFGDSSPFTSLTMPVEFQPAAPGFATGRTVGLAIANTANTPASVTLRLVHPSGVVISASTLSLPAFGQAAIDLGGLPAFRAALPPTDFIGSMTISASTPVVAIGLLDDLGPFSAVPPSNSNVPIPASSTYLPHVVTGNGYSTKITVTDLSGAPNSLVLTYLNQDGSTQSTENRVISPGGTVRIATSESARFGASTTRSAVALSQGPLATNLFFEVTQSSAPAQVINAVGFNGSSPVTSFTMPVELQPAPAGFAVGRTVGLAIQNTARTNGSATIRLVDQNGIVIAASTQALPAQGQVAIDLSGLPEFHTALPASDFVGSIAVSATVPVAAIGLLDDLGPFSAVPLATGIAPNVAAQTAPVVVTISPTTATLAPGGKQAFTSTITGTSNTAVTWSVNGVVGGNATVGTITSGGIYTAPAVTPNPNTVTVTATSLAAPTKSASATVTNALTLVTQFVSGTAGGSVTLSDGSRLTVPAGAFASDQMLTVALAPNAPQQPPNTGVMAVGRAILLSASPAVQLSASGDSPLQLTIVEPPGGSALTGSLAMADIIDLSGQHNFVGLLGSFDPTTNTSTITVPASAFVSAQTVAVSMVNVATSGSVSDPLKTGFAAYASIVVPPPVPVYGPVAWDGTHFNGYDSCPSGKVLVVVHGINSDIPGAFSACMESIRVQGGYNQVVGLNYNWTNTISEGGTQLSNFLNTLAKCPGITQLDIEAHSKGVPVSLVAYSQTNAKITNLVMLGGPINGTPAATLAEALLLKLYFNPLLTVLLNSGALQPFTVPGFGLTLDQIVNRSDVADELTPGNSILLGFDQLAANKQRQQGTRMITACGTPSLMPEWTSYISPVFAQVPFDELIPFDSCKAIGTPLQGVVRNLGGYDALHHQLECNPKVMSDVAGAVGGTGGGGGGGTGGFTVTPSSLSFSTVQSVNPPSQSITITNTGNTTNLNLAISSSQAWLIPSSFSATPNPGQSVSIGVSASVGTLTAGTYTGTLTVSDVAGILTSQTVAVTLTIGKAGFTLSPSSVAFSTTQNVNPASQSLTVLNTGTGSLTLSISSTSSWLTKSANSVTLAANQSSTLSIGASVAGLAPGTYTDTITFSDITGVVLSQTVTVTLTITANTFNLTYGTNGTGTGAIGFSVVPVSSCGSGCVTYNSGQTVVLTATPNSGSTFAGWSGACSGTGTCTVVMNANKSVTATFNTTGGGGGTGNTALTIPGPQTAEGSVNSACTGGGIVQPQTILAWGGAPTTGYTWTLVNGTSFPPGTTVDSTTGVFHGTGASLVAGNYTVRMNVSDGVTTATGTFAVQINSDTSGICGAVIFEQSHLGSFALPNARVGSGYGSGLYADGNGTLPWTWSLASGSLPPGLVIDSTRGVVRGTPTAGSGQTFSFGIKVVDARGNLASCPCVTYQITVN